MKKGFALLCTALLLFCAACAQPGEASREAASSQQAAEELLFSACRESSAQEQEQTFAPDFEACFEGLDGCAVLVDGVSGSVWSYNEALCGQRVSPYSTFKIVSALIGLESGVLSDEADTMPYSGAQYPNPEWNRELTLREAFSSSCVWYFRRVLDEAGRDETQAVLDKLSYGNRDISEWEGSGVNPLPELNGFWLSSSLLISPKEQVDMLQTLFGEASGFDSGNIELLKSLMRLEEKDGAVLYGKTGTGPQGEGWFVGFLQADEGNTYFSVYLPRPASGTESSGSTARGVAERLLGF